MGIVYQTSSDRMVVGRRAASGVRLAVGSAAVGFGDLDVDTIGLTIVEPAADGVWSGDAPSRTVGVNPVEFVGAHDPTGGTNGVATPANVNDYDQWTDL